MPRQQLRNIIYGTNVSIEKEQESICGEVFFTRNEGITSMRISKKSENFILWHALHSSLHQQPLGLQIFLPCFQHHDCSYKHGAPCILFQFMLPKPPSIKIVVRIKEISINRSSRNFRKIKNRQSYIKTNKKGTHG